MAPAVALWIVRAAGVYLALGLLFAIPFLARGAGVLEPAARHAGLFFRLLLLPGAVLLWPWLLARWSAHRREGQP